MSTKPCGECQTCRDNARFEGMTDYGGPPALFGRCERMSDDALAAALEQIKQTALSGGLTHAQIAKLQEACVIIERVAICAPPDHPLRTGEPSEEQRALAEKLADNVPIGMPRGEREVIASFLAREFVKRGVVVLPPAVAEVLRTGEPNEAIIVAMRDAVNGLGPTSTLSPLWAAIGRAVLAVLR